MAPNLKIRPVFHFWHRWFGLLGGLWLILLSVTGSIIVFYSEIDTALNRDLWFTQNSGTTLTPGELVEAAETAVPGAYVQIMNLPDTPQHTAAAIMAPRADAEIAPPRGLQVFIDPYSGDILGERVFGTISLSRRDIMGVIYELHIDLMLGETMVWFLGFVALLWIIDHGVSIYLSARSAKSWTQMFGIRRTHSPDKLVFDWHRALGMWLLPLTLMLAVSGLYLNWYDQVVRVISWVSPMSASPYELVEHPDSPIYEAPVSIDEAIALSVPGEVADIDLFRQFPHLAIYNFRLFDARDIDDFGRRHITIDAMTGNLLGDKHQAEGTPGEVFMAWQYPLHSGRALGWPGRIVIFLSGWVVTGLTVTGLWIWFRRMTRRQGRAPSRRAR